MAAPRKRRANGEASRQQILDATIEIAGERGYEGTTISLVKERSGLPFSSIYWHFKNKDELVLAVVERSMVRIAEAAAVPPVPADGATDEERFHDALRHFGSTLAAFPDFLRLGLTLALDHNPDKPLAKGRFIEARRGAAGRLTELFTDFFDTLTAEQVERLVVVTMAMADGFFIAAEVDEVALPDAFDQMATVVLATAEALARS